MNHVAKKYAKQRRKPGGGRRKKSFFGSLFKISRRRKLFGIF